MTVAGAAALFAPAPRRWGLRGDPHLWDMLAAAAADWPPPADAAALERDLAAAFRAVVGQDWNGDEPIPVAALAKPWGGMSNGMVDPRWWRQTGVPLLLSRLAAAG